MPNFLGVGGSNVGSWSFSQARRAACIFAARSIDTLFYAVRSTDAGMLALPAAAIFAVAVLAVLPAIRRAVQTNPAEILRAE